MTRLRFTLAQLMATVILIGLGFAALRSASLLWASAVFTLTVAVLSAAILGAMARRGRARMAWAGFALFGWIYLGTTFGPWETVNGVTAPPYVFRWGLDYWDSKLWSAGRVNTAPPGEELVSRFPMQGIGGGMSGGLPTGLPVAVPIRSWPDAFQFRRIGHCLAAIMFGLVGMVLGRLTAAEDGRSEHA
jgi:hypothetical protein